MNPRRRKIITRVIVFLLLGAIVNVAVASTTNGDRQAHDVRALKHSADAYFLYTGHYPMTDAASTWFQKLCAAHYIHPDNLLCDMPPDAPLPLDLFGRLLVYEVANPTAAGTAVIRCIGEDGIDNQGAGDDLDSRYGANLGYWNKWNWRRFFAFTFGGWLLAMVIGGLVLVIWRTRMIALGLFLLVGGVIVGIVVPMTFGTGFLETSASRLPRWGNVLSLWSCFAVPVGLGLASFAIARLVKTRRTRINRGLCPACAYPVGTSPVCTECGVSLPLPLQRERAGVRVGRAVEENRRDQPSP